MVARRLTVLSLLALLAAISGCRALGSLLYFAAPRQWVEPEYVFEPGKLLVLIEPVLAADENPVVNYAMLKRLDVVFKAQKVPAEVLSYERTQILKQSNPEFGQWSLQRVGRAAEAQYVLYLRISDLRLVEAPDDPLVSPRMALHAKLVSVDAPDADAVVWPDARKEREGRAFTYSRPPQERTGAEIVDREARNLGYDVAERLARYFYKFDAEEKLEPAK